MIGGAALTMAIASVRLHEHGYSTGRSSLLLGGYAIVVLLAAPYLLQGEGIALFALKVVVCAVLVGALWVFLDQDEKAAMLNVTRRKTVRS